MLTFDKVIRGMVGHKDAVIEMGGDVSLPASVCPDDALNCAMELDARLQSTGQGRVCDVREKLNSFGDCEAIVINVVRPDRA